MEFVTQLQDGVFKEMLARFSAVIPRLTFALMVLALGWLFCSFVRRIVRKLLENLQIDQLGEKLNDSDVLRRTGVRIQVSAILAQMVYYVFMLAFIVFATDVLGIPAITDMVRDLIHYLPALFSGFVLFLIGLFLADVVRSVALTTLQSLGIAAARIIASGIYYFLLITVAISALAQADIQTGFIASNLTVLIGAGAGAFALGYGLASRDLLASYLASHYNKNKVRVGDEVELEGVRGKVVLIDTTSLILQTSDRAVIFPLSKLAKEKIQVFYPDGQEENLLQPGQG